MLFNLFKKTANTPADTGFTQKLDISRPQPIDREAQWDKTKTIISKTDKFGTIEFVSDSFVEVSGYSREELIGKPHNIIRHPDMPKVIFKVLWDNLLEGNNLQAVVKNLTKNGEYYWVITNFVISRNANKEIVAFMGQRSSLPSGVITRYIEPLYHTLLEIERVSGVEESGNYLNQYFERIGKSYTQFLYDAIKECGGNADLISDSVFSRNSLSK